MRNYLGVSIAPATPRQIEQIVTSETFATMPLYPRYGSVAVIDGVLVVKLNEVG